jgi:hypothetical protein
LVGQKLHLTIQFIFLLLFFIWGGGGLWDDGGDRQHQKL